MKTVNTRRFFLYLSLAVFGACLDAGAGETNASVASPSATPASSSSRPQQQAASRQRMTNADFPTQLRDEPDSFRSLGKIPPATSVQILDMRVVQLDKFKENWYRVEYDGKQGWVRGDELEGESSEKTFSVTYTAPELPGTSAGGVPF